MEENAFSQIVLNSEAMKKEALNYSHRRYLYDEAKNSPRAYFVGITGLRGIGKTVLLLQLANSHENSLYFSADAAFLRDQSLYAIVHYLRARGYKNIFIDEIHYKENWQQDLKTIYDEGGTRIFFSGSSAIEIKKGADLSKRALLFALNPLSFREYLIIKKGIENLETISAKDIFDFAKRKEFTAKYAQHSSFMEEYFARGGLLYPSGDISYLYKALENTLEKIIHSDLEYLRGINITLENDIYRLLERIALSPVGETNYSRLSGILSIPKPTLIRIVDDLVKVGIIRRVLPCEKAAVKKEPKLYLAFPFRVFFNTILARRAEIGSLREEFFVSHVPQTCYLKGKRGEKTPDFVFSGKKLEIGGEGKKFYQNPDFVVKDSVSLEHNVISLFLFGFLY